MITEDFKAKKTPQLVAALAANMGAFAWGTIVAWSAAALPKIREDGDFGGVTSAESSWIGSIATLGACVAGLPAGWAVDYFGRKKTMLFVSLPFLLGWLLIYFSQNVAMIISGRFITGFCGGTYAVTAPIFIAETAEPKIRGMLISGYDLMICTGMLVILTIGKYISWENQALFGACIPLVCFLLVLYVPESPRYLLSQGLQTEGSKSLQWFRGARDVAEINHELFQLTESVEASKADTARDAWKELLTPHVRKAFLLSFLLFFFQIGTGIIAVNSYTVDIFLSAGSAMNEYDSSILLSGVQVVASLASASVVDRFGRRILLLLSQALVIVSLSGLGTFFNLKEHKAEFTENSLGWLPLTCLLVYLVGYTIGMGPIPFGIAPEVLPQRSRGLASSILSTWRCALAFLVTRFFANLIDGLGDDGCYWFFAAVSLLGIIFIFMAIPETKGKTLEEIQSYFTKS